MNFYINYKYMYKYLFILIILFVLFIYISYKKNKIEHFGIGNSIDKLINNVFNSVENTINKVNDSLIKSNKKKDNDNNLNIVSELTSIFFKNNNNNSNEENYNVDEENYNVDEENYNIEDENYNIEDENYNIEDENYNIEDENYNITKRENNNINSNFYKEKVERDTQRKHLLINLKNKKNKLLFSAQEDIDEKKNNKCDNIMNRGLCNNNDNCNWCDLLGTCINNKDFTKNCKKINYNTVNITQKRRPKFSQKVKDNHNKCYLGSKGTKKFTRELPGYQTYGCNTYKFYNKCKECQNNGFKGAVYKPNGKIFDGGVNDIINEKGNVTCTNSVPNDFKCEVPPDMGGFGCRNDTLDGDFLPPLNPAKNNNKVCKYV